MNPVTFSTLACPTWSIDTIIAKASDFGYDGIEWRGGAEGHVQPDMPAAQKTALRHMSSDAGLMALAVTAYTSFVSDEERRVNLDELRRYADLAAELGASYVRAFLGELPTGMIPHASMYEFMADCLNVASEHAISIGVRIAIEPHDDFARSSVVASVFNQTHPAVRVIWDIGNAFAAGEHPAEGFELLKDRLAYVQVKDGKRRGNKWRLCSFGEGHVPLGKAFELLLGNGYEGALSVEWEYAWHPELDPPEIALPAALRTVKKLLANAQPESA
ncbi:MAG: sugar phosphate isomerase/epimerase [Anaerolineae bacterium]|nr:sugar phosphate isomerase/epimerase [Anaerolineae bacterium]MCI0608820.1 sugar phosphate isomerase/epimerase [Anaerolineae bacterium]